MPKYKKVYQEMILTNKDLFTSFKKIHDLFNNDPAKHRAEFNEIGSEVQNIIREYEDMLCNYSESGKYGKYSSQLSEKFWELIRLEFPRIDDVGVE